VAGESCNFTHNNLADMNKSYKLASFTLLSRKFSYYEKQNIRYILGNVRGVIVLPLLKTSTCKIKGKAIPVEIYVAREKYRSLRILGFLDNRHVKVERLSALHTGCLYSQWSPLLLITIRVSVDSRAIVRPEELSQREISYPTGNRTPYLPFYSAVSQLTAPPYTLK
jgi:hypothetical protein